MTLRALLMVSGCAAAVGCALAREGPSVPWDAVAHDDEIFPLVVDAIMRDPDPPAPRVDPRPLRPDPAIVALKNITVFPERIDPDAGTNARVAADSVALSRRMLALAARGIPTTDAVEDSKCPGAMGAPTPERQERRRALCPGRGYKSLAVTLPREGGAYWPNNLDKRSEARGRTLASVRVIENSVSPSGSISVSYDLVFERGDDGSWRFRKREMLLLVE